MLGKILRIFSPGNTCPITIRLSKLANLCGEVIYETLTKTCTIFKIDRSISAHPVNHFMLCERRPFISFPAFFLQNKQKLNGMDRLTLVNFNLSG